MWLSARLLFYSGLQIGLKVKVVLLQDETPACAVIEDDWSKRRPDLRSAGLTVICIHLAVCHKKHIVHNSLN